VVWPPGVRTRDVVSGETHASAAVAFRNARRERTSFVMWTRCKGTTRDHHTPLLRRGELFALWWWDIDQPNRSVHVRAAAYEGVFDEPKTLASLRIIPLPDAALQLLAAWKGRARTTAAPELLFSAVSGYHPTTSCVGRSSPPVRQRSYDVRRGSRSGGLIPHGRTIRACRPRWSRRHGHTKVDTTMNVYTRCLTARPG
jgi:hypothetical protein